MDSTEDFTTNVLLVEDNPLDIRLMRYAFSKDPDWRTSLTIAEDGDKAIRLLDQNGNTEPKHDFVVLDLNLPKRDGTEVLQWIRSNDRLRGLPVAVVSSSPLDVIQNKVAGASVAADGYFVKPMDVDEFLALTKSLRCCYQDASKPS
jgi:DNA-binding response OmpR family regulator